MSGSSITDKLFWGVIYVFILSKLRGWYSTKENDRLMATVLKNCLWSSVSLLGIWILNTFVLNLSRLCKILAVNWNCSMPIKGSFHQQITDNHSWIFIIHRSKVSPIHLWSAFSEEQDHQSYLSFGSGSKIAISQQFKSLIFWFLV